MPARRFSTENYAVIINEIAGQLFVMVERQDGDPICLVQYAGDDDNYEVGSEPADAIEAVFV
jgi:hypothetical protein